MPQAPQFIEAPTFEEALRILDQRARQETRKWLCLYFGNVPPLRLDDVVALTTTRMTNWWLRIHQRGCRLDRSTFNLCSQLGVQYAVGTDINLSIWAGVLPRVLHSRELMWKHIERWLAARSAKHDTDDAIPDSREGTLFKLMTEASMGIALPARVQLTRLRQAVGRWHREHGTEPSREEINRAGLSGSLLLACGGPTGIFDLLRVEKSGALGLQDLAIRDKLGRPRQAIHIVGEASEDIPNKPGLEGVVAEISQQEQVARVREIVRVRKAQAAHGRLRQVALEHYEELKGGDMPIRALARQEGCRPGALQRALHREDQAILEELEKKEK